MQEIICPQCAARFYTAAPEHLSAAGQSCPNCGSELFGLTAAHLRGLRLPASKLEVIATAEANGAPQSVLEALQRLDEERFAAQPPERDAPARSTPG